MTAPPNPARIGVDIGGTFTDIVLQLGDGTLHASKVSTTPEDPGRAVVEGLRALLAELDVPVETVAEIVHGTTVGSNTILQKTGGRTGVLSTKGFRDILEIGRIRTPGMFDLTWEKPEPLAPRRWRLEVDERVAADGEIVTPLDPETVLAAGRRFVEEGVEAVAVCFINSYANPAHERAAARLLREAFPDLAVTASCDVLPEVKEYERTSTTVVNAYLLKEVRTYIENLARGLADSGFRAPLLVVSSAGGMMGAKLAGEKPVTMVGSGPAGGVAGASRLGRSSGHEDAIVFDMGGTTAKASIIEGGEPMLTAEYEFRDGISSPSRFIKGGGYMLKVPAIDIAEVGAGGGSIAWIDEGGMLQVGPRSAGADPGPACYGRGNDQPTVTDANVHLGFLNPGALAGGSLRIDRDLAARAIERHVAEPLGIPLDEAAHGIREVANVNMGRAIRAVTIERGRDPRDMALMAFGGSGPTHAADLARQLGISTVVVPILSGVFCSIGMLASDVEHNFVRSMVTPLDHVDADAFDALREGLRDEGEAALIAEGYANGARELVFSADLRYLGQSSELTVPYDGSPFAAGTRGALHDAFQHAYRSTFGYDNDEPLELVNLRLAARGVRDERLAFDSVRANLRARDGEAGSRSASFARNAPFVDTPVVPRGAIGETPGAGPLIVETYDTTIVVPPGAAVHCDSAGSLVIEVGEGE